MIFSGLVWEKVIPREWKVISVWHAYVLGRGRVLNQEDITSNQGIYPVYSSQTENNGIFGSLNTYDFDGEYITWTTDGANAGTVFLRQGKFNCTNVCGTLKSKNTIPVDNSFVKYCLQISTAEFVRHDINPKLMNNVMSKIRFPLPPLPVQKAIAAFLDKETARIDTLIAKKERQIELLQEKRQAVISRAVTKGLDPNARMKDSGVEWLGEVPEHWEVKRLKYVVSLKSGDGITVEEIEDEAKYPVYGGNGFRGSTNKYTHEGEYILIGRQGALCGNINYAQGKFWASEHAVVATPPKPVAIFWLGELLRIMNLNQYSVSAAQPGLAIDRIKELFIPVPPLSEQQAIAAFLDRETAKIDVLVSKVGTSIEKLKEFRTAIITATVSGQIEVPIPVKEKN